LNTNGYVDTLLFINGEWCEGTGGATIPVFNPATEEQIGVVARATKTDLERAVIAANAGFREWRKVSANDRAALMKKAASLLRERAPEIAKLLTIEQGKPIAEATGEIKGAADFIDWCAEEGRRIYGRVVSPRSVSVQQLVLKEPVGPVAAFTPWNFPVSQVVRKLAVALAAGCSFVVKAPEETPASPAELIRAFADAGVPKGVVGLVYGDPAEISTYLTSHPLIRKISFTGSTAVGKQLASLAGQHMKRTTMELGGHAPVIVAADADVELAVKTVGVAKFRNAGQVCVAPTRFLVHNSIRAQFVDSLVAHAEGLRLGDGLDESTTIGPLANERRVAAMTSLMKNARETGAKFETGGEKMGNRGFFFAPTVLNDVTLDSEVFNGEPFGPVAAVRGFDTLDEAIEEANRLPYGLAGYAFTNSIKSQHQLMTSLEVGMLFINQSATPWPEMPFGGVKDSGYGSEGGPEALEAYVNTKSVTTTTA
jgi:succinate-semialdehyde dehydrogenase / glutarate-semialdehyde dehydrogenase